jgi:starch synthase
MRRLRICLASSEVVPFAKSGGLADVSAALSDELHRAGHDVRVFMPMYRSVAEGDWELRPHPRLQDLRVTLGERTFWFSVSTARAPRSEVEVHFVRCPELFDRDGLYTQDADEHLRFALFSRAVLESCQHLGWAPDVVHANDWHTGLLPLYVKTLYAWDRIFQATRTVLTIHNIGYQGVFDAAVVPELGLEEERRYLHQEDLEDGRVSFLKTGVLYADVVTAVSETYAREIQTPAFGMGMEELLSTRSDHLVGIVNGIDAGEWDPATDKLLPHRYDADDLSGKARNRANLLASFSLDPDPAGPVLGVVSRLTFQKGFELLQGVLPKIIEEHDVRLVAIGTGEDRYQDWFQELRDRFPTRVAFFRGYSEELAHRVEAGADCFLMPSRWEPCGLNQMYSLRYGTAPIVRRTGGLADTVEDHRPGSDTGTGFVFDAFEPAALDEALRRALEAFADPGGWRALVRRGMARDFSWVHQAQHYVELYERLLAGWHAEPVAG